MSVNTKLLIIEGNSNRLIVKHIIKLYGTDLSNFIRGVLEREGYQIGGVTTLTIYPDFYPGQEQPEIELNQDAYRQPLRYIYANKLGGKLLDVTSIQKDSHDQPIFRFLKDLPKYFIVVPYFE